MLTATDTPDAPRGATLFARIPLAMSQLESQCAFEQPLGEWLTAQGVEFLLRCFGLPELGFGIEVQTDEAMFLPFVVEKIAELGAPPQTVIEIESDKARIEMTLAQAAGM